MKRYDLHMHTVFSPDSRNKPLNVLKEAKRAGLNGIAITDHHTIKGALLTKQVNEDKDFEVIVGEEVTTDRGDVIALFIKEEVRSRDLLKVIEEIRNQGGLVVIPHPFRPMQTFRYPLDGLVGKIDGIETLNSRSPDSSNEAAARVAKTLPVAAVGSSDAHILLDIGKAYTLFEGELRTAIMERTTRPEGSKNLPVGVLSHIASGWFKVSGKIVPPR